MSEIKFLNLAGLTYYTEKLKEEFALKADVDELEEKIDTALTEIDTLIGGGD